MILINKNQTNMLVNKSLVFAND